MKTTAKAPANVGLIKYWGRKDEQLKIAENASFSVNLSHLITTTTVEFDKKYKKDEIYLKDIEEIEAVKKVVMHLDRIRKLAKISLFARVASQNSFPSSTGLSSSSSGFAALTLAGTIAAGLNFSEKELSRLARLGSGSACRSIPDGYTEWHGVSDGTSFAVSIFPHNYWEIVDIVAIVSTQKKDVSSSRGQMEARTSPFYPTRLLRIEEKLKQMKESIKEKNFRKFGELLEEEALELHAVMLTQKPSLIYWTPQTLSLMKKVREWRQGGIPVYFTINTGQDIHLFCEKKTVEILKKRLAEEPEVRELIVNTPSRGAHVVQNHLF